MSFGWGLNCSESGWIGRGEVQLFTVGGGKWRRILGKQVRLISDNIKW